MFATGKPDLLIILFKAVVILHLHCRVWASAPFLEKNSLFTASSTNDGANRGAPSGKYMPPMIQGYVVLSREATIRYDVTESYKHFKKTHRNGWKRYVYILCESQTKETA